MADPDEGEPPKKLAFHYVKSGHFRVIHADGIIGGITPRGLIHFAIYSERPAIPQIVVSDLSPEGKVSDTDEKVGKPGIVREMDVDVILDCETARAVADWLRKRADDIDAIRTKQVQLKEPAQ